MGEPASLREAAEDMVERTAEGAEASPSLKESALRNIATKRKGLHPALLAAQPLAQGFDALSTLQAIKAGGREGNSFMAPFADNPAAMIATKVGGGALIAFLADRLARSGHKNAAKVLSAIDIAAPVGAGIHNMALAGRPK